MVVKLLFISSNACMHRPTHTPNRHLSASPAPQGGGAPPQAAPIYKGEVPSEDVKDDPNMSAPAPSAPPPDLMDRLPGYESIGFSSCEFSLLIDINFKYTNKIIIHTVYYRAD